jgi:hypothetical protein
VGASYPAMPQHRPNANAPARSRPAFPQHAA